MSGINRSAPPNRAETAEFWARLLAARSPAEQKSTLVDGACSRAIDPELVSALLRSLDLGAA